jgi:hypothetical protein
LRQFKQQHVIRQDLSFAVLPFDQQRLMQYFEVRCGLDAYDFDRQFASNAAAQKGKSGAGSQLSAQACRAASRWTFHLHWPVRESSSHLAWIRMDFI